MGIRNERRTWRLLNFEKWPIWWALGLPLICAVIVGGLHLWFAEDVSSGSVASAVSPFSSETAQAGVPSGEQANAPLDTNSSGLPAISPESKQNIERLFEQLSQGSADQDKILRELKRSLLEAFAGQEDCWSCEGAAYFDRYDQIAGKGEARKPLGLREWIEAGDEAYLNQKLPAARKYYSSALMIMDERAFQEDEPVDSATLERVRSRCVQLKCH